MNIKILTFVLSFLFLSANLFAKGYLLHRDDSGFVWWTEGVYKVMKNDELPSDKKPIQIFAAANESESFQIVLSPKIPLTGVTVSMNDFVNSKGEKMAGIETEIRRVEYINVKYPSGLQHHAGDYPDPLPLCDKPFTASANEHLPLWITVTLPANAKAGDYRATLIVNADSWSQQIPVKLKVWNFALPHSPRMRSAFGLYGSNIKQYHNLKTKEELLEVQDLYFQTFKKYRISPQRFFEGNEVKVKVGGVPWLGGMYDPDTVFRGRYSLQVTDRSYTSYPAASFHDLIGIDPAKPYVIRFRVKTLREKQIYAVAVKCYDENKNEIPYENKLKRFFGSTSWQTDSLYIDPKLPFFYQDEMMIYRPFPKNTVYASVQLYAVLPDPYGFTEQERTGTAWFDELVFEDMTTRKNLLPQGNFEPGINQLKVSLDFTDFDKAARRYLDEFGFTGFRYKLSELRGENFDRRKIQHFNGFVGGTSEYEYLITSYLSQFQDHLEKNGWLGKEYLYWIDEPKQEDYWFVREGMEIIKKAAPKLVRLITENNPGPEIMDVTDIGCPVLAKFDYGKSKPWMDQGRVMWSYLMTWPKLPHLNLFIDNPYSVDLRMWAWISYKWNLTGMLCWCTNYWNASNVPPSGKRQSVWDHPMIYYNGYAQPVGGAAEFGNGEGMFVYPPNRDPDNDKTKYLTGPVPSIRLSILRDGIDDYDYMKILEDLIATATPKQSALVRRAKQLLVVGDDIVKSDTVYTKEPQVLLKRREQIALLIEQLKK